MIPEASARVPGTGAHACARRRCRYPVPMHEDEDDDAALFRAAVGKVVPLRQPRPAA